jgi:hypothetical protein
MMRIMSLARHAALLVALGAIPVAAQQETGYLKAKIDPSRAGVFVDGKYVGPAKNFGITQKYAVAPGQHEVRLCDPRYEDVVTTVTIQPGKTTKLHQQMKRLNPAQPPFGRLRTVAEDKYSAVYVNGRYMGHADEFSNSVQGLQLNPGEYAVKVVPLGGEGKEEHVTIEANKVTIVKLD